MWNKKMTIGERKMFSSDQREKLISIQYDILFLSIRMQLLQAYAYTFLMLFFFPMILQHAPFASKGKMPAWGDWSNVTKKDFFFVINLTDINSNQFQWITSFSPYCPKSNHKGNVIDHKFTWALTLEWSSFVRLKCSRRR